jgi:hypothetical protein
MIFIEKTRFVDPFERSRFLVRQVVREESLKINGQYPWYKKSREN